MDSKVGAISSENPSPIEGMEPDFKSIKGDWNILSIKSHHILSSRSKCSTHVMLEYFDCVRRLDKV